MDHAVAHWVKLVVNPMRDRIDQRQRDTSVGDELTLHRFIQSRRISLYYFFPIRNEVETSYRNAELGNGITFKEISLI